MDFLDPKKQRRHAIMLYTGYALIGIAIAISTIVLVYQANGFGVTSKGEVVQNGLAFFSSQPNPADIYLNGKRDAQQTNTRMSLAADKYEVRLARTGYRDWTRNIVVQGGDVQNFDYPFLFPTKLATKAQADYAATPGISTQSSDRKWLLVQQTPTALTFDVYDLSLDVPKAVPLTLPAGIATASAATQSWKAVQWADDATHVLVQHTYGDASEFILIDRNDSTKSLNLNKTLSADPSQLTLIDNKYDKYHLYDTASGTLSRASLGSPTPVAVLQSVLSYKSYGDDRVLFATATNAPSGKVMINMLAGDKTFTIRQVSAGTTYLLDVADYKGTQYVVLGAASENIVYVYRDPVGQLGDSSVTTPTAMRALRITNPSYVSFSPNAQYIMSENGPQFGVYDLRLKRASMYTLKTPLDAPQAHATWMDSHHLGYVGSGSYVVFDYDGLNYQTLMSSSPAASGSFSPNYRYAYTLAPNGAGTTQFTQTPLLTTADL